MIFFIILLSLTAVFLSHNIEAYVESVRGDKRHWITLWLQIAFAVSLAVAAGFGWWSILVGFMYVGVIRPFFDWMYNFYKGHERTYLGEVAKSDKKLEESNLTDKHITIGRFIMSGLSLNGIILAVIFLL